MQYAPALSATVKKGGAKPQSQPAPASAAAGGGAATVDRARQRVADWLTKEVGKIFGASNGGEDPSISEYILSISTSAERAEYITGLLGAGKKVSTLIKDLEHRIGGLTQTAASTAAWDAAHNVRPLQKEAETYGSGDGDDSTTGPAAGSPQKPARSANGTPPRSPPMAAAVDPITAAKEAARQKELGGKLKVKYVKDKRTAGAGKAPGVRERCYCGGLMHGCWTNCTGCGRIVCALEGDGPCFFCSSLVTKTTGTTLDAEWVQQQVQKTATAIASRSGKSAAAAVATTASATATAAAAPATAKPGTDNASKTIDSMTASSLADAAPAKPAAAAVPQTASEIADAKRVESGRLNAVAHKDRLLAYARDQAVRSLMIDDQADYFDMGNTWLSADEKVQAAIKKKEDDAKLEAMNKRSGERRVTLDFHNRSVIAEREKDIFEQHRDQMKQSGLQQMHPGAVSIYDDEESSRPKTFRDGQHREIPFSQAEYEEIKQGMTDTRHFANDTLHGRAKRVYDDLKERLRKEREDKLAKKRAEDEKAKAAAAAAARKKTGGDAVPVNGGGSGDGKARMPNERTFFRIQHDHNGGADPDNPFAGITESEFRPATDQNGVCAPGAPPAAGDMKSMILGGMEDEFGKSEYDDKSDGGITLSMHQPWASLVVYGIKRFEGRGWSASHRGRLWIASTAREASQDEIDEIEREYRHVYGSEAKIPFPTVYPQSALLGCVDMVDCVTNEQFQKFKAAHPHEPIESSDSQFLFVCTNPRVLRLMQRISGAHKLWELDKSVLKNAQAGLKPISIGWRLSLSAFKRQPALDLWPPGREAEGKSLASAAALNDKVKAVPQRLRAGMVLIRNFLSVSEQQELVDACRAMGMGAGGTGGFYHPSYKGSVHQHLRMFCIGKHWNLQTSKYTATRTDYDNAAVPAMPQRFKELVTSCINACRAHLNSAAGSTAAGGGGASLKIDVESEIPNCAPDICLINFYDKTGKLGFHRDKDESEASLKAGTPVISFSIGDSGEFAYSDSRPSAIDESLGASSASGAPAGCDVVRLSSGDALVFGGPARHVYHGITKVHPNTAPRGLKMRAGRLNLTFRQY